MRFVEEVVAGATSGAGTLACAFFCANGVAAADLFAPPDALVGTLVAGLPVLSDVLFGVLAMSCRAMGLSESRTAHAEICRDGAPHAATDAHPRRIDKLYEACSLKWLTGVPVYPENRRACAPSCYGRGVVKRGNERTRSLVLLV